jgi:hypothetical protein
VVAEASTSRCSAASATASSTSVSSSFGSNGVHGLEPMVSVTCDEELLQVRVAALPRLRLWAAARRAAVRAQHVPIRTATRVNASSRTATSRHELQDGAGLRWGGPAWWTGGGGAEVLGVPHRARLLADAGRAQTPPVPPWTRTHHRTRRTCPRDCPAVAARQRLLVADLRTRRPTTTVWKSTLDGSPPASSHSTTVFSAPALRNGNGTW